MIPKKYSRTSFFLFFALAILLALYVIWPFIHVILLGVLIAYIFYPLYSFVLERTGRKTLSAFLTTLGVFIIILIPFVIFATAISDDVTTFYKLSKERLSSGTLFNVSCTSSFGCDIITFVDTFLSDPGVKKHLDTGLSLLKSDLVESTSNAIFSLPRIVVNFFVMVFTMFYSFRDGQEMLKRGMDLLPLKGTFKNDLKQQTQEVIYATVYGNIVVSIAQGILGTIGFAIFGISSPVLWGAVMIFAALLPFIGSALVWLPAGAYLIIQGTLSGVEGVAWKGIGLLVYGLLVISTVDNFLKPRIIGRKTSLHPLLIVIGLFGGVATMGFLGLILGPVILAIFVSFIKVYAKDKESLFDHEG